MSVLIESMARQIASVTPATQAKIFQRVAEFARQGSIKELAEVYQAILNEAEALPPREAEQRLTQNLQESGVYNANAAASPRTQISEEHVEYSPAQSQTPETPASYREFFAVFDGEALRPEERIELERNARYRVLLEKPVEQFPEIKIHAFQKILEMAFPAGIHDFAEQHDHYLYGVPKK